MSILLETSLGDIVIDLNTEKCPLASKNFIKQCKMKYYNNALFIEVQKDYIVQIKSIKPETSFYELTKGSENKYFADEI